MQTICDSGKRHDHQGLGMYCNLLMFVNSSFSSFLDSDLFDHII